MEIEIYDMDKTDDTQTQDNMRGYSTSFQRWEGKIKYKNEILKFEYTDTKTEENGGHSVNILSKQSKNINDDEWAEIEEYIEEDYSKYKYYKKNYKIEWE